MVSVPLRTGLREHRVNLRRSLNPKSSPLVVPLFLVERRIDGAESLGCNWNVRDDRDEIYVPGAQRRDGRAPGEIDLRLRKDASYFLTPRGNHGL